MVVALKGVIEGNEVIFSFVDGNLWQVTIPAMETGEYVTALYAVDDAGNETYFGTILYVVDLERLYYNIEFIDYAIDCELLPMKKYYIDSAELMGRVVYFAENVQE